MPPSPPLGVAFQTNVCASVAASYPITQPWYGPVSQCDAQPTWPSPSGIATMTAAFVARVRGLSTRLIDTRKTTPGLRVLEKYAVRVGGGHNHRFNLADGVLLKDNHLAALRNRGLDLAAAIGTIKQRIPHT